MDDFDVISENDNIETQVVNYFRTLIELKKKQCKATTPRHFAGNVGRHMKKEARNWFLLRYPNPQEYLNFFNKHKSVFIYDPNTGQVNLNSKPTSDFFKPLFCIKYENEASLIENNKSFDTRQALIKASEVMLKFELVHIVFSHLKMLYGQNICGQSYASEEFNGMFDELKSIKEWLKFEYDHISELSHRVIHFLTLEAGDIFECDIEIESIFLKKDILNKLPEVTHELDNSLFEIFKTLLVKLILYRGPHQLISDLNETLTKKHAHIMSYLFEGGIAKDNDYKLIDFARSFHHVFILMKDDCKMYIDLN